MAATPNAGSAGSLPAVVAAALLLSSVCHAATPCTDLRVAKARVIVESYYDHDGRASFYPWIGTLIREHERIACAHHAPEFAGAWWWSLVYGGANFSLRCYAVAPGSCAGPLDVKHAPPVTYPPANIRHHVAEMWTGYQRGYRGRGLCEYVMYPARPHDWGGGRFASIDAKHRARIQLAYERGELPSPGSAGSLPAAVAPVPLPSS